MFLKLKQTILNWLGVTSLTLPVKIGVESITLKDTDILVVYSEQCLSEKHIEKIKEHLTSLLSEYNYNNKILVVHGGLLLGTISKER